MAHEICNRNTLFHISDHSHNRLDWSKHIWAALCAECCYHKIVRTMQQRLKILFTRTHKNRDSISNMLYEHMIHKSISCHSDWLQAFNCARQAWRAIVLVKLCCFFAHCPKHCVNVKITFNLNSRLQSCCNAKKYANQDGKQQASCFDNIQHE